MIPDFRQVGISVTVPASKKLGRAFSGIVLSCPIPDWKLGRPECTWHINVHAMMIVFISDLL